MDRLLAGGGKRQPRANSYITRPLKLASGVDSRHTNSGTPHAVEMAHEGVPLVVVQRQLRHANLGITSVYLQGIDSSEIIDTVHSRPAPVIPASAGLIHR